MRRRLLALACAIALLATVAPASAAGSGPYVHVWQAEAMVGGDLGGTARKNVGRDEMRMTLAGGGFAGTIRYEDALAVQAASGAIVAQFSSIEVALTGASAEGGAEAAGSFVGTATVTARGARSLDDLRDRSGKEVVYEVSGHWGARLANGIAHGELLYERATPVSRDDPTTDYKGPVWFNRLSAEAGGGSQTFEVEVAGLAPGTTLRSETATGAAGKQGIGVLGYVRRGASGGPGTQAPPVPLALSDQARRLKDAEPAGAVKMPANALAIDVDVPGAYLDAKNRAAGLLGGKGPVGNAATVLASEWRPLARDVPAKYVPPQFSSRQYAEAIQEALRSQASIPGASELASDVARAAAGLTATQTGDIAAFRHWREAASAVGSPKELGSVLGGTADAVEAVRSAPLPRTGALADAVRVAALAPEPPRTAKVVTAFARQASMDASGSVGPLIGGGAAPAAHLDLSKLPIPDPRPSRWIAYRRTDGALYWLGTPGNQVAITDGTLHGAGFTLPRSYLVDAADVGRVLAVYPSR